MITLETIESEESNCRIRQQARNSRQRSGEPRNTKTSRQSWVQQGAYSLARPQLIRKRLISNSPMNSPTTATCPLQIITAITVTGIDRAIEDAEHANKEFVVRDENSKVSENFT